jgi:Arc/MetJ-type ribon-helix-helix transcriptional regulator
MHHYATYMRTTLMIYDELYLQVKRLAAGRRTSVSQVVNDALRRELSQAGSRGSQTRVSIPVYGGSSHQITDTSPAEFDAMLNDEI